MLFASLAVLRSIRNASAPSLACSFPAGRSGRNCALLLDVNEQGAAAVTFYLLIKRLPVVPKFWSQFACVP